MNNEYTHKSQNWGGQPGIKDTLFTLYTLKLCFSKGTHEWRQTERTSTQAHRSAESRSKGQTFCQQKWADIEKVCENLFYMVVCWI